MLESALRSVWPHDVPLCFPRRACVDEPPVGALVIDVTSALTHLSPAIAVGCFITLGASLVLLVLGLRLQWRGAGLRPWLAFLATALLLGGIAVAWAIGGRLAVISGIYRGLDGGPSSPTPVSLTGAWPMVLSSSETAVALGAIALFLMLNTAAMRERRGRRLGEPTLPASRAREHRALPGRAKT